MRHPKLREMWLASLKAVERMEDSLLDIDDAISKAVERLRGTDGRLIYIGAGTSGRLGVQDGVELKPTFAWNKVGYSMAGGDKALTRSIEGAEDNKERAVVDIEALNVGRDDVCIAIAASGTTPYTNAGCEAARDKGALTIAVANKPESPLLDVAECSVFLDSGAEILAGSTRMTAGTLQKMALNFISTLIMEDLGRVYQGRMVFVQVTCDKLVKRATGLIQDMSGCSEDMARQYLEASERIDDSNRCVPSAILAAAGQMNVEDGHDLLIRNQDHFGKAYESLPTFVDLSQRLEFLRS